MRLTERTDIAVRILIFLSLLKGQKVSIDQLSEQYIGHRAQIVAAVQQLRKAGMIGSTPGRNGGIWIEKDPSEITVAEIVRMFETAFAMTTCMNHNDDCALIGSCRLPRLLNEALQRFFEPLEAATIADLIVPNAMRIIHENREGAERLEAFNHGQS